MLAIKKYESMAMLDLSEEEREEIGRRLDAMVSGFEALEHIDVDDAEPLVTVLDLRNVMREDVAKKQFSTEEILANAPEEYNGYFKVPGTLE
ncbi:MAG: Asp-tRNA(Asn)/Glu-tRNA(Gln) amidotransferase subunit GatC [Oscillospiraceae bacterium]|nr:Asp-tRNA(Asn)/Glu-tRNA(Gln) amidotransferase subunit GatC [Oscillospiraceae bacterium]